MKLYTQRADLSSDSIDPNSQIESDRAHAHVQLSDENDLRLMRKLVADI